MCTMPDCNVPVEYQTITSTVPGAVPVSLAICPSCDFGRCMKCKRNVLSRTARQCPNGHFL